jgi:hypothetical protein
MARPMGVTFVAVLAFLAMVILILSSSVFFMGGPALDQVGKESRMGQMLVNLGPKAGVMLLVLAAIAAAIGVGLLKLQPWARGLAIIWFGLGLFSSAWGGYTALQTGHTVLMARELVVVAIDLWILLYLFRPHVKQAFRVAVR